MNLRDKIKRKEQIAGKEKAVHGQYQRQIEEKDKVKTWKWLRKSNLKGYTEALISSDQEHDFRK